MDTSFSCAYHSQIDGQNHSLGDLLHSFVDDQCQVLGSKICSRWICTQSCCQLHDASLSFLLFGRSILSCLIVQLISTLHRINLEYMVLSVSPFEILRRLIAIVISSQYRVKLYMKKQTDHFVPPTLENCNLILKVTHAVQMSCKLVNKTRWL